MITGNNQKVNAQWKLKEIEIKEKEFLLINIKNTSHHRVRELALWEKIKQEQIKIDPSFDRVNVENELSNIDDNNENQERKNRIKDLLDEIDKGGGLSNIEIVNNAYSALKQILKSTNW